MNLASALPMAFVMVAGPQIVTAIMLATSKRPKPNSFAFLGGVAAATTVGLTLFYVIADAVHPDSGDSTTGSTTLNVICLLLLVALAGIVYRNRGKTDPPAWMTKLQDADPSFALRIGFLLFAVMPSDLITMFTVSNLFAHANEPWWHTLVFMGLTVVFAATPLLLLLVMGRRAETTLPKVRNRMTDSSWIVNEAVVGLFLLMSANSLFG